MKDFDEWLSDLAETVRGEVEPSPFEQAGKDGKLLHIPLPEDCLPDPIEPRTPHLEGLGDIVDELTRMTERRVAAKKAVHPSVTSTAWRCTYCSRCFGVGHFVIAIDGARCRVLPCPYCNGTGASNGRDQV